MVLPLVGATMWAVAVTTAVLHLVIGMAIGSLVVGATAAALQPASR